MSAPLVSFASALAPRSLGLGLVAIATAQHQGLRRRERPDVEVLLGALTELSEPAAEDAQRWSTALPEGFRARVAPSPRSLRVAAPLGEVLVHGLDGPRGLGPSAARRAHDVEHGLFAAGAATLRVLGFVERRVGRSRARSWLVTDHVRAPTLGDLHETQALEDPELRRRCGAALAEGLRRVHALGLVLGPLDPRDILVTEEAVLFTRLDRARRRRGLRPRAQDLASLALGLDGLRPGAQLRFLVEYVGRSPTRRDEVQGLARAARRELRRASPPTRSPSMIATPSAGARP